MTESQSAYTVQQKTWNCRHCGYPLGAVVKRNGVLRLRMDDRGIYATGRVDVTCFKCGSVREWHADAEAIKRLVEMTGRKYKSV